jgi:integrase
MLNNLPKTDERIFPVSKHGLRITFEGLRERTATKLNNPRLRQIHFHTFRHWKATMEYHKTKDIIHVKTFLGHKTIEATMIYINIESALFLEQSDEWTSRTASNVKEDQELIDSGFEYVTERDGIKIYRKRK